MIEGLDWWFFLPAESTAFLGICAKLEVLGALNGLHALGLIGPHNLELGAFSIEPSLLTFTPKLLAIYSTLKRPKTHTESPQMLDFRQGKVTWSSKTWHICVANPFQSYLLAKLFGSYMCYSLGGEPLRHMRSPFSRPCTWCTRTSARSSWWS